MSVNSEVIYINRTETFFYIFVVYAILSHSSDSFDCDETLVKILITT